MHGLQWRARQLELSAGLQRNRPAAGDIVKADDVAALHDRLPAEQMLHAVQQRADATRPFVGNRRMIGEVERRLFVLGTDPELIFSLLASRNPRDQFVARRQRRHIDLVTRHEIPE
jgi:hypothetical protein